MAASAGRRVFILAAATPIHIHETGAANICSDWCHCPARGGRKLDVEVAVRAAGCGVPQLWVGGRTSVSISCPSSRQTVAPRSVAKIGNLLGSSAPTVIPAHWVLPRCYWFVRRLRVRAALREAAERPSTPLVTAAFLAAADRREGARREAAFVA